MSQSDGELKKARDAFRDMLTPGTAEPEFQRLFSQHPCILSRSLPLKLEPTQILPLGRPGQAEVDFLIYPNERAANHLYGSIEIKRPDSRILREPRKQVLTLASDASTALAQAQKYARQLGNELAQTNRPVIGMGNEEYMFLIMGLQSELDRKVTTDELRHQFRGLLPSNCRLYPYDTLLSLFESSLPRVVSILMPTLGTVSPRRKGIEPKENQIYWQLIAHEFAKESHQQMFSSRRGIFPLNVSEDGATVLCLYNNNPYPGARKHMRDLETDKFRNWLSIVGIEELGYATYPESGESKGYSYAMILDIEEEDFQRQSAVKERMEDILKEVWSSKPDAG